MTDDLFASRNSNGLGGDSPRKTMKTHAFRFVLLLFAISMLAPVAWSQGRGKQKHRAASGSYGSPNILIVFSTQDRNIISDWFWRNRNGLPPGLANRDSLPPGLQKQLRRNGTLPPGLQKKLTPLPYALNSSLVRLPSDYLRIVIGRDVILLDRRNNSILDIISDVIRDPGENENRQYEARERDREDRDGGYGSTNRDSDVYASRTPAPAAAPVSGPASNSSAQSTFPLKVRTTQSLSTETAKPGDRFVATLEEPVYEGNRVVARKGARAEGIVVDSDEGGRVKGVATLTVKLSRFELSSGKSAEITSDPIVVEANATKGEDATKIGLTTGIGAGLGALLGGGKGAAVGAVAGAATGTGVVLATHGEPAVIPSESVMEFVVGSN